MEGWRLGWQNHMFPSKVDQPTTGRYRLVHRWVLCEKGKGTQGLMYSQAIVRGKFSRAILVAKWCHALIGINSSRDIGINSLKR